MGLRNALYGAQFRPSLVNGALFTLLIPHDLSFYFLSTDFGGDSRIAPSEPLDFSGKRFEMVR